MSENFVNCIYLFKTVNWEALSHNNTSLVSIKIQFAYVLLNYPLPVQLYNIFSTQFIKGKIFEKEKGIEIKYVFRFSL